MKSKIFVWMCVLIMLVSIVGVSAVEEGGGTFTSYYTPYVSFTQSEYNSIKYGGGDKFTITDDKGQTRNYQWSSDVRGWISWSQKYIIIVEVGSTDTTPKVLYLSGKDYVKPNDFGTKIAQTIPDAKTINPDIFIGGPSAVSAEVARLRMNTDYVNTQKGLVSIYNKITSGDVGGAKSEFDTLKKAISDKDTKILQTLIQDEDLISAIIKDSNSPAVTSFLTKIQTRVENTENIANARKTFDSASTTFTNEEDADYHKLSADIETSMSKLPDTETQLKNLLTALKTEVDKWDKAKTKVLAGTDGQKAWNEFINAYNSADKSTKEDLGKLIVSALTNRDPALYLKTKTNEITDIVALENSLRGKVSDSVLNDIVNNIKDPAEKRRRMKILSDADSFGIDLTKVSDLTLLTKRIEAIRGSFSSAELDNEELPDDLKTKMKDIATMTNPDFGKLDKDIRNLGTQKRRFDKTVADNGLEIEWEDFKDLVGTPNFERQLSIEVDEEKIKIARDKIITFNFDVGQTDLSDAQKKELRIQEYYDLSFGDKTLRELEALIKEAETKVKRFMADRNTPNDKVITVGSLLSTLQGAQRVETTTQSSADTKILDKLIENVNDPTEILKIRSSFYLAQDLQIQVSATDTRDSLNRKVSEQAQRLFDEALTNIRSAGTSGVTGDTFGTIADKQQDVLKSIQFLLNNDPSPEQRHRLISTLIVAYKTGLNLESVFGTSSSLDPKIIEIIASTQASKDEKKMYVDYVDNLNNPDWLNSLITNVDSNSVKLNEDYQKVKEYSQEIFDWWYSELKDMDAEEKSNALAKFGFTEVRMVIGERDTLYVFTDNQGRTHIVSSQTSKGSLSKGDGLVTPATIELNTGFISKVAGTQDVSGKVYEQLAVEGLLDLSADSSGNLVHKVADQKFKREGTKLIDDNTKEQKAFVAFVGDKVYVADVDNIVLVNSNNLYGTKTESGYTTSSGRVLSKDGNLRDDLIVVGSLDSLNIYDNMKTFNSPLREVYEGEGFMRTTHGNFRADVYIVNTLNGDYDVIYDDDKQTYFYELNSGEKYYLYKDRSGKWDWIEESQLTSDYTLPTEKVSAKLDYGLDLGFPVYKGDDGNYYNQKGENINDLLKLYSVPITGELPAFTDPKLARDAISRRQSWQNFWKTTLEGPNGPVERAKVDWATEHIFNWEKNVPFNLESSFWKPQDWEKKLCESGLGLITKRERPKDVKFETDRTGNQVITMSLQGSKQTVPRSVVDTNTGEEVLEDVYSYEIGWSINPVESDVEYTICLGGCTNCYTLELTKPVTDNVKVSKQQSSGNYVAVISPLDLSSVAICYLESKDGAQSSLQEYKVPVVGKSYDSSGFGVVGASSGTNANTNAGTQGPNTIGTSPSSKPQTAQVLPK